jgi:hypothetical protein
MAETTPSRARVPMRWRTWLAWLIVLGVALLIAAELLFFVVHARQVLSFPYPLDYGEGPLLAQVNLLLDGTPIWRLYADPGQPPYAVVNYPPIFHLTTLPFAWLLRLFGGGVAATLLAGRLVSLAATVLATLALWWLARGSTAGRPTPPWGVGAASVAVLCFVGLPIVREWGTLMRVDVLGLCLGLWGLVLVQRYAGQHKVLWAALPLVLSLFVKPSLIAAPTAALLWLLLRDWRRALSLGLLMGVSGLLLLGLLHLASGGWFSMHILAANVNAWEYALARDFWRDQFAILAPLFAAAVLGLGLGAWWQPQGVWRMLMPLSYTLAGAAVAVGVGKVGAYTNYFLELYAGLIWLTGTGVWVAAQAASEPRVGTPHLLMKMGGALMLPLLAAGALLRYYPLWSETFLMPYGVIEQAKPARIAFGSYAVWDDLARERKVLAALGRINAAMIAEVQATNAPILTDIPGAAAQAGRQSQLQAFEHRQLLDAGLWDQRGLLRDLANGEVPLVALDYLGNWLSPETITLITHRYALTGSRGSYDLYEPVALPALQDTEISFANGPRLVGFAAHASASGAAYQPGETLILALAWQRGDAPDTQFEVVAQLRDAQGAVLHEQVRPLLYGALLPSDWGDATLQHIQPLVLPLALSDGDYEVALTLRENGRELAPPQVLLLISVVQQDGRVLGEQGYFVPDALVAAWIAAGGYESYGPGDPLMPAVPLADRMLQCFARACFELRGATVTRLPLGELVALAETGDDVVGTPQIDDAFALYWEEHGGEAVLGPPITGAFQRGDVVVQYTTYARLERPLEGSAVRLGRLGDDFLQLPGGVPYRWP